MVGIGVADKRAMAARAEDARNLDGLTPQSVMTLEYIAVPPPLRGLVTTFYHFRCDEREIRDVQPAAVGHLIIFLRGHGRMVFASGRNDRSHPASLMTPCNCAAAIKVEGPFHCIGAALSPAGWAAFTGLHAAQWCDRLIPATEVFGAEIGALADRQIAAYAAGAGSGQMVAELAEWLARQARPLNPRHEKVMRCIADWLGPSLDPPLDELYRLSPYSQRQTQRLVERYYGLCPRELRRKYRAVRIATMLGTPGVSDEKLAQLTDHFFDQSHMIREIRHFVGRTPGRLAEQGDPILTVLLDIRNFREITPQVAAMPPALDANDSQ